MASLKLFWQCMFAPRLIKIYGERSPEGVYRGNYQANNLERWGDQVIHSLYVLMNVGLYTSPLLATILYRRGHLLVDSLLTMAKVLTGLGLTLAAAYCFRAFGRANNTAYLEFQAALNAAIRSLNKDTKKVLSKYDFDFTGMPVDFKWNENEGDGSKQRLFVRKPASRRSPIDQFISLPCQIAAYLAAHTFGIRMVFPGSISLLGYIMGPVLLEGRIKLVREHSGVRYKLQARDGNEVDSFFVDQRKRNVKGDMLVICSEGNAGFYELGIMVTPLEAGYSVLGWNHPGFGGSTGMPYPDQELNAMDVVMQFAIHGLNFPIENIILFGWSIGGYSTSWAAMNYPDVNLVVIDASFDDILPLALPRMPSSLEPLVRRTIRDYINLNVAEQLIKYPGPVQLIRRTDDEIICTEEMNLSTNRGNDLLVKLLKYRYPLLMTADVMRVVNEWLAADINGQSSLWQQYRVSDEKKRVMKYFSEHAGLFPLRIGDELDTHSKIQMVLYLCRKYMLDLRSSHCTPLPASMFATPLEGMEEPQSAQFFD
ncbi:hypothetical protein ONE63_009933 [Megalurothrips usitatus]|uniref:Phosphatidylserine lipase ABHD16A n=1 Tax=Megalurothrips usitatus TaxID=439358 RepID=A0AAV7XMR9_9NEOP|nr:hypothetical protein ONE63_009933 [Megalurothrips usitatus]